MLTSTIHINFTYLNFVISTLSIQLYETPINDLKKHVNMKILVGEKRFLSFFFLFATATLLNKFEKVYYQNKNLIYIYYDQ